MLYMGKRYLNICSRCGRRFQELGVVLRYGKFYPGFIKKVKSGIPSVIKEIKVEPTFEIKEALCVECSKEVYDRGNRVDLSCTYLGCQCGGRFHYMGGWVIL